MKANPHFQSWPINLSVTMAYADDTRSPAWSPYDFSPSDLTTKTSGCTTSFAKNKLTARDCGSDFNIEIVGFDARRELDTRVKVWKNAQSD